jgi:hypothetical protein
MIFNDNFSTAQVIYDIYISEEAIIAWFMILFQYLVGWTKQNIKNLRRYVSIPVQGTCECPHFKNRSNNNLKERFVLHLFSAF